MKRDMVSTHTEKARKIVLQDFPEHKVAAIALDHLQAEDTLENPLPDHLKTGVSEAMGQLKPDGLSSHADWTKQTVLVGYAADAINLGMLDVANEGGTWAAAQANEMYFVAEYEIKPEEIVYRDATNTVIIQPPLPIEID